MRKLLIAATTCGLSLAPGLALAQDPQTGPVDSGDTAWMLVSAAFVLLMAVPGLTLFYGGLLRTAGALAVAVQIGAIAAVASLLWIIVGYTLAFGEGDGGWLGAGNAWMLMDLGNVRGDYAVPESAFALFQMCLAAIAPALMVGAWADRARFGWVLGFCGLWGLMVYAPVAHWLWGGGWLAAKVGTLDFAGGLVVHVTAGVSALVAVLLLGGRTGSADAAPLPGRPALTMAGLALLWVGWFGFSGGSAFAANDDAASAIINTHVAACMAAIAWIATERVVAGRPTGVGFATGALAGLVTVSPAAGYISPGAAIVFGMAAAGACYPMAWLVKQRLKIDDVAGIFAVHGIGGITGSLLAAVFLAPSLGGIGYPDGVTPTSQFAAQAIGAGAVAIWSAVATAIAALMVSMIIPMRRSEDEMVRQRHVSPHDKGATEID